MEKCDEAVGVWAPVRGAVRENAVAVSDLIEGKRYLFRVCAINMMGQSEPGETLTSVLAKNPFGKASLK